MKRKSTHFVLAASVLLIGLAPSVVQGASVIYEDFTFPDGDTALAGNAGGTGLSGNWTATTPSSSTAEATNLTYGSLSTSGSATVATGWNANSPYVGIGGTTLNGLTGDSGELWMSLLYQAPSTGSIRFTIGIGDTFVTTNGDLNPAVSATDEQAIGFSIPFNNNAYPVMKNLKDTHINSSKCLTDGCMVNEKTPKDANC